MEQIARTAWTLGGQLAPDAQVAPERRARALSGLPARPGPRRHWLRRLATSWLTWFSLALFVAYGAGLWSVWRMLSADQVTPEGTIPGLDWPTIKQCARYAAPTALVWSLAFILLDRLRPLRPLWWLLAFGWGSCMSIWFSIHVNSWVSTLLNVSASPGDPAAQARPAVFAAPFVEEASKATIIFLVAVLVRYRVVSVLQAVCLSGLAAVGFAFTENIVYYARAMVYGSVTIGTGDVEQAVQQLVFLRGVITSYGHPLFTMFTAIGMVLGLRTRSKLVRVLAPLTGFVLAALGHMLFNGMGTLSQDSMTSLVIRFVLVVGFMLLFLLRQLFKELKRIRTRLEDYQRLGWLAPGLAETYGSARSRSWLLVVAARRGWRCLRDTLSMMRAATELAYLRDAMVRGIVDAAGQEREAELLTQIAALRPVALHQANGLRLDLPWHRLAVWRRRRARELGAHG